MKDLLNRLGISKMWAWLIHPHAFAYVFLFCGMLLYGIIYVDIPTKDKTALNIGLDTYLENWRLHASTTKIFVAKDAKDYLSDECRELERMIYKIEQSRLNIVGHPTLPPDVKAHEISRIMSMKGEIGKKLQAAELELLQASRLYDKLVAQR